jgi:CheY-like chemotaxis protein
MKKRILVVETKAAPRHQLQLLLRASRSTRPAAEDGCGVDRADLVLTDLKLPNMTASVPVAIGQNAQFRCS